MFDENEIQQEEVVETQEEQVEQVTQKKESDKEINMRNLRERAESERREKERLAQELEYYKQQLEAKNKFVEEEPDDIGINDEDFAEGKHLNKVAKKISQVRKELEATKKQLEEQAKMSALREQEIRLQAKYPDIEQVVTPENLQELQRQEPAIANAIKYNPNLFEQGEIAYKMIKKLGIIPEPNYESQIAKRNVAKPRSSNSINPQAGETPLQSAYSFQQGSLTKEMREKYFREMEEAIKNG